MFLLSLSEIPHVDFVVNTFKHLRELLQIFPDFLHPSLQTNRLPATWSVSLWLCGQHCRQDNTSLRDNIL